MKAFVMDAFSEKVFSGNQAGVMLVDRSLSDEIMQAIAAEFKHSETAFIFTHESTEHAVKIRYFTPAGEVELCGHATIASFALLRKLELISDGDTVADTKAGRLNITVNGEQIWMDMAAPKLVNALDADDTAALYSAFGLRPEDGVTGFEPMVVSTGLSDIIMPVCDRSTLLAAVQNEAAVSALSKKLDCVGVHMFASGEGECTAYCSNFAPLFGIPEECATGTANGALTYYLYLKGLITPDCENSFIQGEHMGRPSKVLSRLCKRGDDVKIRIGGSAVMSMECELML
ncbi:MAG: PhzF family phenazine biosynthesis protein [Clostridia bacterium]|nr:PhzF family phenazine biosynthesis protein [Clostridia bacterium]